MLHLVGAQTLERLKIKKTPKKELPTLMGTIKDKENQKYEQRLKGEEP